MYDPGRDSKVSADAFRYGLWDILIQRWEKGWKPVAYSSCSLTPTAQRYTQVEKEALGLTWACERLGAFLTLDLLKLRIQRFRMLNGAGTRRVDLDSSPVKTRMPTDHQELMGSTHIYTDCVI